MELKEQIVEIKKQITEAINKIELNEQGQLLQGFIFIPIDKFMPGKPTIVSMCDPDMLQLKMSSLIKNIRRTTIEQKIMQSTQDPAEREMLLKELDSKA